jgi:glycosyltransferase involved in cell wall biosynthesis
MKISACIVVKNEEVTLERCLKSISELVSEIILVHDGDCEDKSLEIASMYGSKIFTREYIGEAEFHRPFSYSKAKGDWILQIDADEFIDDDARELITSMINNDDIDAYSFYWPYSDGKGGYIKRGPFSKTYKPCLFRKSKLYMIGVSHEYPRTYGNLVKKEDIQLLHQPKYDNFTYKSFKTKWLKWAKLQAEQIINIKNAPTFNVKKDVTDKCYAFYDFMTEHPILSGLIEMIKFILIYMKRCILLSDLRSIKIAFLELSYLWFVRLFIKSLKSEKK